VIDIKVANQRDLGKFVRLKEEHGGDKEKEEEEEKEASGSHGLNKQQYGLGQAQNEWVQVQQGSGYYPMMMSGFVPVSSRELEETRTKPPHMYSSSSSSWVGHKRGREDDDVVGVGVSSSHQDMTTIHRNIADFRLPTSQGNSLSSGSFAFIFNHILHICVYIIALSSSYLPLYVNIFFKYGKLYNLCKVILVVYKCNIIVQKV
jgi:hypothetical protein